MNLDTQLHTPIFKDKDIDLGKAINSSNISLQNKAKTIQNHVFFCLHNSLPKPSFCWPHNSDLYSTRVVKSFYRGDSQSDIFL